MHRLPSASDANAALEQGAAAAGGAEQHGRQQQQRRLGVPWEMATPEELQEAWAAEASRQCVRSSRTAPHYLPFHPQLALLHHALNSLNLHCSATWFTSRQGPLGKSLKAPSSHVSGH